MRQALALFSAVLIVGCGAPEVDRAPGPSDDGSAVLASFPSNAPDHFGFGSDASAARVAMWDIDVKPDGEGLPPGSGTVAQGQRVFLTHCVACHGATGTEGPNDRLVGTAAWEQWPNGQTVGNYWPYATTLYDYIRRAMPQLTPGILTSNETYAVVGYILNMNGLVPADAVMDAATLPAVEMPARDRFVLDDREGGPEVR
jgi:cytochrome c